MRRLACAAVFAAFAVSPTAAASDGGPSPGVLYGWTGITAPGQPVRYVTLTTPRSTVLESISRSSGRVRGWISLNGLWGIPLVANDGTPGGLSRDGRYLVVAGWNPPRNSTLRQTSTFKLVNTRTFRVWRTITLPGDFSFDALSPGGGRLFLIEHVSTADATRYRVRAYDIAARRLLPHVIADRRQSTWVMRGYPVSRATSADGRWIYTLYQQADGFPFVHALDAVDGTAVCVGIPWKGNQNLLPSTMLKLDERAGTLTLQTRAGRPLFLVDTKSYWVSRPSVDRAGFPFAFVLGPLGGAALLALGWVFRRRLGLLGRPSPLLR